MRNLVIIVVLALLSGVSVAGEPADSTESRTEAAARYLRVADFPALMDSALKAGAQALPSDKRAEFLESAKKHIHVEALEAAVMSAMVKNFTTKELDALANFYGSPDGRSATAKFGAYMADIMPMIQTEMKRAMEEMRGDAASPKKN